MEKVGNNKGIVLAVSPSRSTFISAVLQIGLESGRSDPPVQAHTNTVFTF